MNEIEALEKIALVISITGLSVVFALIGIIIAIHLSRD